MDAKTVAVDVGSGFTQYTDGTTEGYMPSIVCGAPDALGFGAERAQVLTVDGKRYLVGKEARAYGDPAARVNTLHDDWAGSIGWKVLLLASLHQAGIKDGDAVQLVTGLPQALFTQKYAGIESLLAGEVSFKVNQEDVTLEITPETMPQAAGALFFQAKQDESILKEAVGVVDVGTYTTGFSVIEDGMFIDSRSGGCSVGVSQLAAALQENLLKEHGYSVDAAKIPQILMDKAIRHRGNPIDIADLISNQAMLVSRPMLEALRKSWNGGSDLLVYVAGGGAPYYLEAIKTVVPHAQPMADSFFAVVRGMHNYLLARR